ncbi:MAG: alpha/beta hydrolase [Nitrosomonas sp.]|jgi:hypothetical protein|nr:alpha/beta hydrolase [Nitrosomonas sp.]
MLKFTNDLIPDLLVKNISRDVLMGVEEALIVGSQRAYADARGMNDGHLPSVVGQLRHFHMNESFHRALEAGDASPTPILGNTIVTGRIGLFTLARFNIKEGIGNGRRRSQTRKQMSKANVAIEPLVQSELFADYIPPSDVVVFFVACFSNTLSIQPDAPLSIQIAVPDRYMDGWLFREPIDEFIKRYDQKPMVTQDDLATPKLKKNKKNIESQGKDGTTQ